MYRRQTQRIGDKLIISVRVSQSQSQNAMYRRQTQCIGDKLIISVRVSQSQSQAKRLQVKRQRKRRIVTATLPQSIVLCQFIRGWQYHARTALRFWQNTYVTYCSVNAELIMNCIIAPSSCIATVDVLPQKIPQTHFSIRMRSLPEYRNLNAKASTFRTYVRN